MSDSPEKSSPKKFSFAEIPSTLHETTTQDGIGSLKGYNRQYGREVVEGPGVAKECPPLVGLRLEETVLLRPNDYLLALDAVYALFTWDVSDDQSLLTGLQAIPAWGEYFSHPTGNHLGLITASLFFPAIVFCPVGGWIANEYGRRVAIWIGVVLLIAGAIVNALSRNVNEFIGSRVIIGTGGAIVKVAAPALLQELAHPRLRSVLGAMYYGFFFTGSITSSWMCVAGLFIEGEWSWRFPAIFQIVGPLLVSLITLVAPESPRFYVKKGEPKRALEILAKYHANGDEDDELVHWEMREITMALEHEQAGSKMSYLDFFRTSGNRRRLMATVALGLGSNWVGNGVVS
ncbi:hypothetical protein AAF712_006778 [Marasmius tenuissimus]|uniref:Major facilitator superfamily (MFS) profile domain-containing protein n=1 Tax=Marasmius tenuissimus TaxID=585030 RepID=A0ABR2ZYD8_9AGAR